jgi:hypothetical protein
VKKISLAVVAVASIWLKGTCEASFEEEKKTEKKKLVVVVVLGKTNDRLTSHVTLSSCREERSMTPLVDAAESLNKSAAWKGEHVRGGI